jgi:hypothetical protein
MKTKLLSGALVAFPFFSFAQQLADKLTVQDTKKFTVLPGTYSSELRAEFKLRSGNKLHQLNFNDGRGL